MAGPVVLGFDPDTKTPAYAIVTLTEILEVGILPASLREFVVGMESVLRRYCPALAVVEGQDIYEGSKVSPNDIKHLAQHAGVAVGVLGSLSPSTNIAWPEPREWKQQQPKKVNQGRSFKHYGIGYVVTVGQVPYCYPSGCAKAARIAGAGKLKQGDWKHVADAVGLALYGAKLLNQ